MTHVGIIIVNWNGIKDTLVCLQSLSKLNTTGYKVTVIVVDNASEDGSVSALQIKFPKAHLLRSPVNVGFTGGNNLGIRYGLYSGCEVLWLLNNDTVVDRHALRAVRALNNPHAGVVGSKIYFAAGREFHHDRYRREERGRVLWYAGGIIDWNNVYASHRGVDEVDHGQYDAPCETDFVTGCSMMMGKSIFQKIGFFDERYYLYLEDVDFCIRAIKAGFSLWYEPSSILWHVNAGSSGKPGTPLHDYYLTRNRLLFGFSHTGLRTKQALMREAIRLLLWGSRAQRRAVGDFMLRRFGRRYEPKI